jgi:acyl-CoA thioester hydrolase
MIALQPALATSHLVFRVRFCETDLMGIVHHANYLPYFEMGRVEWLRARGVTYAQWAQRGVHLPVVEVTTRYRKPVRFDDELTLTTTLAELKQHSLRYDYRLRLGGEQGELAAEGSTRLASVIESVAGGVTTHKLAPFSDEMLAALTRGELGPQ